MHHLSKLKAASYLNNGEQNCFNLLKFENVLLLVLDLQIISVHFVYLCQCAVQSWRIFQKKNKNSSVLTTKW